MTQEEKELLFKDLCARIPYDTIIEYNVYGKLQISRFCISVHEFMFNGDFEIEHSKPYLRPISSMTEEEIEELKSKCTHNETEEDWDGVRSDVWCIQILEKYDTRRWDNSIVTSTIHMDAIDWLNSHHFDYRNLIEKGLALEAPKDMYEN